MAVFLAGLVFVPGLMRGSGEIPNGLGIAQECPILWAPAIRPVVHSTRNRWHDSWAAAAAWVRERYVMAEPLQAQALDQIWFASCARPYIPARAILRRYRMCNVRSA